jgi:hypothetical protein
MPKMASRRIALGHSGSNGALSSRMGSKRISGIAAKPRLIIITTSPNCSELSVLKQLEGTTEIIAVGKNVNELDLAPDVWPTIDVLLNCGGPD